MLSRETERARAGLAYDLPWRGGHAALLPIATGAKRHCWCRTAAFVLPWNGRVTPSDRSPPRTAGAAPCDLTDARTSPHRNSPLWRSNAARPPGLSAAASCAGWVRSGPDRHLPLNRALGGLGLRPSAMPEAFPLHDRAAWTRNEALPVAVRRVRARRPTRSYPSPLRHTEASRP